MLSGGIGSRAIKDTVRQSNMGDLLITNKRIMFVGKNDSFEFKNEKISIVKLLDQNSFVVQSGRSSKNVWLDINLVAYAYGLINFVINQTAQGADIYESIKSEQSKITSEQVSLCNQVRNECSMIKVSKPKKKTDYLRRIAMYLHFEDTNQWRLETDYAAYGGKDLGWIEKCADEWNVDLKDFVK